MAAAPVRRRVLIVELDTDLAELARLILASVGYEVTPTVCGPTSLTDAKTINPDVILLDLGSHAQTCGWQLLAHLRADPDTQGIPIVVISDTETLLEDAVRSFNVRQELIKPYNIEDLENAIAAAVVGTPLLPHPAAPPTAGPIALLAAGVISRESDEIMARWIGRVQREGVLGPTTTVPVRVLVNNIAVWLIGLVAVLRYGACDPAARAQLRTRLASHIGEVQRLGISLTQAIRQYEILHDETWQALARDLTSLSAAEVFELGRTVDGALDEVLVQVAEAYTRGGPATAGSGGSA